MPISQTKQLYIDTIFELQCCIASLVTELKLEDEIGSNCYNVDFKSLASAYLMLDTLLCWDPDNQECLTVDQVNNIIMFLKRKCKNCCINTKTLKKLLNE